MRTSLCFSLMSYGGSYDFFRPFDKEIVSSECKKLNGRIYVNLKPRTYDCRGHNTIRKAHLHDDMKNYGSETETMCPFSGKPLDTTTAIMLHRKVMWQDHKSLMVLTR